MTFWLCVRFCPSLTSFGNSERALLFSEPQLPHDIFQLHLSEKSLEAGEAMCIYREYIIKLHIRAFSTFRGK